MTNVVGIDKRSGSCPFCGAKPPCPDFTCKRIAAVEFFDEDHWAVEFVQEPANGGDLDDETQ